MIFECLKQEKKYLHNLNNFLKFSRCNYKEGNVDLVPHSVCFIIKRSLIMRISLWYVSSLLAIFDLECVLRL